MESGKRKAASLAREALESLRSSIAAGDIPESSRAQLLAAAERVLQFRWQAERSTSIRRVVNATGVVIHTNLGRAPLSESARRAIIDEASGYCTLEYDLDTGARGARGRRAETLLAELTGAEDALVVNNCAAAAFFVLTAFAAGGEVVISRGELVEIGGDFRIPDVLAQSGATLREVGTTNRTKLADYENAINENTRMVLRVHPSNYRIIGFTATPSLGKLSELARKRNVLLYEDIGSGALIDLTSCGISDEPSVSDSFAAGVDVATFSGDKLLGGPQAGVIVGRSEVIGRLRKHPLCRALRVDKLTYAALQATLESYTRGSINDIPVLRMLSLTRDELSGRVDRFVRGLQKTVGRNNGLVIETVEGTSAVGGGAAPAVEPPSWLISLSHRCLPAMRIEQLLRNSNPPVIARIADGCVLLDLRTVAPDEEPDLVAALLPLAAQPEP